ncbi:MAG: antibiotic biosynthesis monooxygenase, partial [Ectothiorhodospiraceae bacterium]|nr:antibiotic biosynthesis monooxygenase [Ectothiorhodospiraceae bacterium]
MTAETHADPPVTVLVTRRPKPGQEQAFEDYLAGICQAAQAFPGHLGVNVFRPAGPKDPYRILFKFDRRSNLDRWENSSEREDWRAIAEVVSEEPQRQVVTGLEAWFTLPSQPVNRPPPRHKMMLVTWAVIYVLVSLLSVLLGPLLEPLPLLLRVLILTGIVVLTMTYWLMPRV